MNRNQYIKNLRKDFKSLKLKKIRKIKSVYKKNKQIFSVYLGLFQFQPSDYFFKINKQLDLTIIRKNIKYLNRIFGFQILKKYKMKLKKRDKIITINSFQYVFDLIPKNTISFRYDKRSRKIFLVIKGKKIRS